MNIRLITLSLLCAALVTPAAFSAETGKSAEKGKKEASGASSKVAANDETFMKTAAQAGMAEVKLGELAKEKGGSAEVKEVGQMMVDDHSKANDELKTLASAKGVELPAEVDAKHKATADKLAKMSGAEFDKAYLDAMGKGHKKAVSEFESASKSAKDADLKAFAEKTLPTLRKHLDHVKSLAAKSGGEKEKGKEKKGT